MEGSAYDEIVGAIIGFVNAKSWSSSQELVEAQSELLLSDATEEVFDLLLEQYSGDERAVGILSQHRRLLAACRALGVDAAFAQVQALDEPDDLPTLLSALGRPPRSAQELAQRIDVCQRALVLVDREEQPELWAHLHGEAGTGLTQCPLGDRAENLERAIWHFQSTLDVFSPDTSPEQWAISHYNLAQAHKNRWLGDRADNLKQAIAHFEQVLEVLRPENDAERWVTTHYHLATTYFEYEGPERDEFLERAFAHFECIHQIRNRADFPGEWASTHSNLGSLCVARLLGERADNLERARDHYFRALEVFERDTYPEQWATLQHNLGSVLFERIRGDRAANLEEAIACYKRALEVRTRSDEPEKWATTQLSLANVYAHRVEGQGAQNQERALELGAASLTVFSRSDSPGNWAAAHAFLAETHHRRSQGDRAASLELAIQHYSQALEVYSPDDFPQKWASTLSNLSQAFSDRVYGQRAENIEKAIQLADEAGTVFTRETFPSDWAMVQNALAMAYALRMVGDRANNLEQALNCHLAALDVTSRADQPQLWATHQHNLAGAYADRLAGERADNLERAIRHCGQALEVFSREDSPTQWAGVHSQLAVIYTQRASGERAANLEQALHHSELALQIYTHADSTREWGRVQVNRANALANRVVGDPVENLTQAVAGYRQALGVFSREVDPEEWGTIHHNLANALSRSVAADRALHLEEAIEHYIQALEVRTRTGLPLDWATTQNDLANAYADRILGDPADNVRQAIVHYRLALEIRTREFFPADHRQTQENLGSLYFREGMFLDALAAYEEAIAAGEDLLGSAFTEIGRQDEVRRTARLYNRAAFCLAETGDLGSALVKMERGKTRLLAEALALGSLSHPILPADMDFRMAHALRGIRIQQAELRLPPGTPARRSDETLTTLLQLFRDQLKAVIDEKRKADPGYLPAALSLAEILDLVPEQGVLIAPLITSRGSLVFVVPHGLSEIDEAQVLRLDQVTDRTLEDWLWGSDTQPGWVSTYGRFKASQDTQTWQSVVETIGQSLWAALLQPIYERLETLGVKQALLLPAGGLQLLPLHAAWRLVEGQSRALLDEVVVQYAPSAYALQMARRRAAERTGSRALVAGIDAYRDLPPLQTAVFEANAVSELLGGEAVLDSAVRKQVVLEGAARAAYLHLACHGRYSWFKPDESALFLANGEVLSLADIVDTLYMPQMRLVTLSACETGFTDIRQTPDEFIGLPAAFLQAGAPTVISSLWSIDDRSSALLMQRFYRNHLRLAMTVPAALREAQLWLRNVTRAELGEYYTLQIKTRSAENEAPGAPTQQTLLDDLFAALLEVRSGGAPAERPYAHPYYWAAFCVYGA